MTPSKRILFVLWVILFATLAIYAPFPSRITAYQTKNATGKIAFVSERDGVTTIYVMNDDGSDQHPLEKSVSRTYVTSPIWSPDGTEILYSLSYPVARGNTEIHIVNADGSNPRVIVTDKNTIPTDPALSPDGKYIAFESNQDGAFKIYVMNVDGSNQHRLTELEPNGDPDPKDQTEPSWSPSGKQLAFLSEGKTGSEIKLVGIDGLAPQTLVSGVALHSPFTWSPDGQSIAYISDDQRHLCILNVQNKSQFCLTALTDTTTPHWSPNGQKLSFSAANKDGYDLFVLDIRAKTVKQLTDNNVDTKNRAPTNYAAVWSPNGLWLSFVSSDDFVVVSDTRKARIYSISVEGSDIKPLTDAGTRNYSPSWQP